MVILKKIMGGTLILSAAFLATQLAYADPIKYTQGMVQIYQCPYMDDPGYSETATGVSLTLDTSDGQSYKGTIAGVDLVQFISTVKAEHKDWNWSSFPQEPQSNDVSVAALSPAEGYQVPAIVGGGTNWGYVDAQVFNVGTLDNAQCQNPADNVGMNIQLKP